MNLKAHNLIYMHRCTIDFDSLDGGEGTKRFTDDKILLDLMVLFVKL